MTDSENFDLVIDTSRKGIALCLSNGKGGFWSSHAPTARGELLDGMLVEILDRASVRLKQVCRILVTLGPGTFTGLRTGIAFCEGLCVNGSRSLHGISTLRALATLAPEGGLSLEWPADVVVVCKARPGYWYIGCAQGEFFDDTSCALEHLLRAKHCVVDGAAFVEPLFSALNHSSWIVDDGDRIESFLNLLPFISASIVQKANYIQDSYFEKKV